MIVLPLVMKCVGLLYARVCTGGAVANAIRTESSEVSRAWARRTTFVWIAPLLCYYLPCSKYSSRQLSTLKTLVFWNWPAVTVTVLVLFLRLHVLELVYRYRHGELTITQYRTATATVFSEHFKWGMGWVVVGTSLFAVAPIFGQNLGECSIFPQKRCKIGAPQKQPFLPPPVPSPT